MTDPLAAEREPSDAIDAAMMRRLLLHEARVHAIPGRDLRDLGDSILLHDPVEREPFWNRLEGLRWPDDPEAFDKRLTEVLVLFASIGRTAAHLGVAPPRFAGGPRQQARGQRVPRHGHGQPDGPGRPRAGRHGGRRADPRRRLDRAPRRRHRADGGGGIERHRRRPARRIRSGSGTPAGDRGRDGRLARPSVVHPLPRPGRRRTRRGRPAGDVRGPHATCRRSGPPAGPAVAAWAPSSRASPRPMDSPKPTRSSTSGSSPTTATRSASTSAPASSSWGRPVPTCSCGDATRAHSNGSSARSRPLPASHLRSAGPRSSSSEPPPNSPRSWDQRRRVPAGRRFDRPRGSLPRGVRRPARRPAARHPRAADRGPAGGLARAPGRGTGATWTRPADPHAGPAPRTARTRARSAPSACCPAARRTGPIALLIEGEPSTIDG